MSLDLRQLLIPLLLVVTANTAAWVAARVFGARWAAPLDFGMTLPDGTRLLGSHKTWRGLIVATIACAAVAQLLGPGAAVGAAFGALALIGDATSSFIKRRLRRPPGADLPGIDQVPEALLPLLALQSQLGIGMAGIAIVTAIFTVLDFAVTRVLRS